jgi:hypothetical protein
MVASGPWDMPQFGIGLCDLTKLGRLNFAAFPIVLSCIETPTSNKTTCSYTVLPTRCAIPQHQVRMSQATPPFPRQAKSRCPNNGFEKSRLKRACLSQSRDRVAARKIRILGRGIDRASEREQAMTNAHRPAQE